MASILVLEGLGCGGARRISLKLFMLLMLFTDSCYWTGTGT